MGLSIAKVLGNCSVLISPVCILHIVVATVFHIVDALIMISRDRASFQVAFHRLFHQGIPGVRPVHIGAVAVTGVDDARGRHRSAIGVERQGTAVEANGDFPVEGDFSAAGLD